MVGAESEPGPPPTRREDVESGTWLPGQTRREEPAALGGTRREEISPDAGRWDGGLLRLPGVLRERWAVVRELPGGGEADVLLIHDQYGEQRVVKIYRQSVKVDAEVARRLTGLDRTFLVAPLEIGNDNGRHWELMEYVPGGSLADQIDPAPVRPLSSDEIRETVRQISFGLNELHSAHITHSDLKPANILLRSTAPLRLALSDFGLSKYLGDASKRFTSSGHTINYAAPESFSGRFSPAEDWWALGMIVRQLATGEVPFAGLSDRVVMHELMVRPIPLDAVADERLRLLCRGLLVRDPDHRWGAQQVEDWMAGRAPDVYDAGDIRATRPLEVADRTCWTRAEAAEAFALNWDRARQTFLERIGAETEPGEGWRMLRGWLEQFDEDVEQRIRLIDQVLTAPVPPDVRMVHLLRWLDPTMPPVYRGWSMLPDHVARVADHADAVQELWDYQLLGLLAQFAGGTPLHDVDRRWRASVTQLESVRVPPQATRMMSDAFPTQRAILLRAAADPAVAPDLMRQATHARGVIQPPLPPWLSQLTRLQDPAIALATLTLARLAATELAKEREDERRRHLAWLAEEADREAGRPQALGRAAGAAGIWTAAVATAFIGAATVFGGTSSSSTSTVDGSTSTVDGSTVTVFVIFAALWAMNVAAELGVAYQIGRFYHPRWSALWVMNKLVRRIPDAFGGLRRASNSVRAAAAGAPVLAGVCCCGAMCTAGFWIPAAVGLLAGGWAVAVAGIGVAHLVWSVVRAVRFDGLHTARREQILGGRSS